MQLSYDEVHAALTSIVQPNSVFELRLLGDRKGQIDSGYFNNIPEAANALCMATGFYRGVYVTLNPVMPELLARSYNRLTAWAKSTTNDPEVTRRRWLWIDIDPKRPSNISASEGERQLALKKANEIANVMALYGFPQPMITSTGNGAGVLYRLDEENTLEITEEIHTFLLTLKCLHDDAGCEIDQTVFNASRICRVPGTWARKGDSTPDRPHRKAEIIQRADPFRVLSIIDVARFNTLHEGTRQALLKVQPQSSLKNTYPDDEQLYKRLNEQAMNRMAEWVPHFFPTAREHKKGWRVRSEDIGQSYEEDLTIHPWPLGIKYFGVADQGDKRAGRRTPVGIIADYALNTSKDIAANKLSAVLGFPINEMGAIGPAQTSGLVASNSAASGMDPSLFGVKPRIDFAKAVRTVNSLRQQNFDPIEWVIPNVLPVGNILLAARPKMRKTWWALQLAMAVASGGKFLEWTCDKAEVLFLGLEDNERRIRSRIDTLNKWRIAVPDLSGFRYWTGGMGYVNNKLVVTDPAQQAETLKVFPRGDAGVDALEQYLEQFPETRLIVIDTFPHFRGERTSRDIYQSDYDAMNPLTKLAARKKVCILSVMHEKKGLSGEGNGADFMEHVTGSAGISGGADGVVSIKGRRGTQEENESRQLLISGRDVPFDYCVDMSFDAEMGGWLPAKREDIKVTIRRLLDIHPFLNQRDMQNLIPNAGQARIYQSLTEMKLKGEIEQGRFGFTLKRTTLQ